MLNYEVIGKCSERITKIKPLMNKYNWQGTNYSSKKDDWKKIEKNNVTIAFFLKKKKIYPKISNF